MATITSSSVRNIESEKGRRFVEKMDDDEHKTSSSSPPVVISGILFSRSVRSAFASFTLAPISSSLLSSSAITIDTTEMDQSQSPILVRLQFTDSIPELRSFCRKQYKIGDQIDFLCTNNGQWQQSSTPSSQSQNKSQQQSWSQQPRWVVGLSSTSDAQKLILVRTSRVWSMRDCQQYQLRYLPQNKKDKQQQQQSIRRKRKNNNDDDDDEFVHTTTRDNNTDNISQEEQQTQQQRQSLHLNNNLHGGGGKEKRLQAQELVSFLMQLIGNKLSNSQQKPSSIEKNNTVISTVDLKEISTSEYVNNTTTTTATNSPTLMTTETIKKIQQHQNVRDWLNRGGGVLDVAGGCGHVSMVLGMNGILSTVVDARESVGKLPKRDRKIWKRSLLNKPQPRQQQQQQQQVEEETQPPQTYSSDHTFRIRTRHHQTTIKEISDDKFCQLVVPPPVVVPFQSQRAWFGSKPCGYDESYRHPDEENLPILVATTISDNDSDDHSEDNKEAQDRNSSNYDGANNDDLIDVQRGALLRRQTSALVALHPDEATGEIVQQAVKHRIPFVVVPCCVFARLFPERQTNNGQSVSSYENLLEYLQELDNSIQRTQFGFAGKNIALWSTFPDG